MGDRETDGWSLQLTAWLIPTEGEGCDWTRNVLDFRAVLTNFGQADGEILRQVSLKEDSRFAGKSLHYCLACSVMLGTSHRKMHLE